MITFKNRTDSADVYIYGEITEYPYDSNDFSAEMLREKLLEADQKPLNIYVNSGGGSVFEGQAISAILERYPGQKTCYIDGICASIATKIPFACDVVNFAKGAYFMIHQSAGIAWGNAEEMMKMADTLEQIDNGLVATYKANSKMDEETIRQKMKAETWYTSENINNDFSFNIIEGKQMVAYVSSDTLNKFKNRPKNMVNKDKPENKINIKEMEFALL